MISKQEKAKQEQGCRKNPNQCSNCTHFEFETEKHVNDFGVFDRQKKSPAGKVGSRLSRRRFATDGLKIDMSRDKEKLAKLVGCAVGLVFSVIFMIAIPMYANYQKNGCVFLVCDER
jgi:hypothetical protein